MTHPHIGMSEPGQRHVSSSGSRLCDAIPAQETRVVIVREGGARRRGEGRDGQSAEREASAVFVTVVAVCE